MKPTQQAEMIFLGFCDRATHDPSTGKWNLLGLGNYIAPLIYPFNLESITLGFSLSNETIGSNSNFLIVDENNNTIGTFNLSIEELDSPTEEDMYLNEKGRAIARLPSGWINYFIKGLKVLILSPGEYRIFIDKETTKMEVGTFFCYEVKAPPLTTERISAIKSDPKAALSARVSIGCNKCPSKYKAYTSLERNEKLEKEGWIWQDDVDDEFICGCGATKINLHYVRDNLHGLLGKHKSNQQQLNIIPLYENSALRATRSTFSELLDGEPREEVVQQFISENPILWHQYSAERILLKPPILSKFNADYGILTAQKELILIEIEKPAIQLLKKDGHRTAKLNHAFEQVRDWLLIIDEHRTSVLSNLNITTDEVNAIRGVVIAGRESSCNAEQLRKLKMSDDERIRFYTYDDLLYAMDALISKFGEL